MPHAPASSSARPRRPRRPSARSARPGAPLPAEGFEWVYEQLPGVWLTSISGGTDVCTAFVGGSPLVPVVAGEISCRSSARGSRRSTTPAAPWSASRASSSSPPRCRSCRCGFWGDDDGRRTATPTSPGSRACGATATGSPSPSAGRCTITGRSDATLNRGGVRLGTSEFYAVVEARARGPRQPGGAPRGPGRRRRPSCCSSSPSTTGADLDDEPGRPDPRASSAPRCRPGTCPTRSSPSRRSPAPTPGKKLEVPVKRILLGAARRRGRQPGLPRRPLGPGRLRRDGGSPRRALLGPFGPGPSGVPEAGRSDHPVTDRWPKKKSSAVL